MAAKAMYDLSKIESKRDKGGHLLQCSKCGRWVRQLETRDGHVWTCARCTS